MPFIVMLLVQLFALMPLSAEMTVVPKEVFIGDEMEIRYTFEAAAELLPEGTEQLVLQPAASETVSVSSMILSEEVDCYVVTVRCRGWVPGSIELPVADVQTVNPQLEEPFIIKVPPVTVQSIVEYTGKKELRPMRGPVVIPGTTWIIYGLILLAILLFAAFITLIVRFSAFRSRYMSLLASFLVTHRFLLFRYRVRMLLKKNASTDTVTFASQFSHFIREYLTARFQTDFSSVTPSEFPAVFSAMMNHTESPEAADACVCIASLLLRCDYVRFSGDAGETGQIPAEERSGMCGSLLSAVSCFDREEHQ